MRQKKMTSATLMITPVPIDSVSNPILFSSSSLFSKRHVDLKKRQENGKLPRADKQIKNSNLTQIIFDCGYRW